MKTFFLKFPLLLGILLLVAQVARAGDLVIEVTQGADEPTPIAIVPFGWDGSESLPQDIAGVVDADLKRSGLFRAIPRGDMLSLPTEYNDVHFRDWKLLGVSYLLVGKITREAGNGDYRIQYELFDVHSRGRLLGEVISGSGAELRDHAHYISDRIYEVLTGIPGIFSTKILYVTANQLGTGNSEFRLQIADVDGERTRTILSSEEPIMSPSWAPDGRRIAYVSFEDGRPGIYIQVLATGERVKLPHFRGLNGAPSWSPDGKRIALVLSRDGNPEIYVMELATGDMNRVTRHFSIDTEPVWTADGKAIIFTSNRGGNPQIYRVTLATNWVERLTFEGTYNGRARVTHDDRYLVYVHRRDGNFAIAAQDLKRGGVQVLTRTALDESPSVAPNGHLIMYATQDAAKRGVLAAVSIDGRIKYSIPARRGDVREPAWSPFMR